MEMTDPPVFRIWETMLSEIDCLGNPKSVALLKQYRGHSAISQFRKQGYTYLHLACLFDMSGVAGELLDHHNMDVMAIEEGRIYHTPLFIATYQWGPECVRRLLKHPQAVIDQHKKCPSFWLAMHRPEDHILKLMIASGKRIIVPEEAHTKNPPPKWIDLVRQFEKDPVGTRRACRKDVDWLDDAALIFALLVFLSDGLLEFKPDMPSKVACFFNMARRLPMELQMVLCHRMTRSARTLIEEDQREAGFKWLTKALLS